MFVKKYFLVPGAQSKTLPCLFVVVFGVFFRNKVQLRTVDPPSTLYGDKDLYYCCWLINAKANKYDKTYFTSICT